MLCLTPTRLYTPFGELNTLQLTPQQWVRIRRLARKKWSTTSTTAAGPSSS